MLLLYLAELTHCVHLTKPKLRIGTDSFSRTFSQIYLNAASKAPMNLFRPKTKGGNDWAGLVHLAVEKNIQSVGLGPRLGRFYFVLLW